MQVLEDVLKVKLQAKGGCPGTKQAKPKIDGWGFGCDVRYDEISWHEAIGAGSFGAVFRGVFRGQEVAIKKCKVGDKKEGDMLMMECRYLQKLRHRRLVNFLGFCHDSKSHFIMVMEYMPGGSLYSLLFQKKQDLEYEKKISMALQIAEGIEYLHANSTVHRDLKTMNIILDKHNNCKICDFGLTVRASVGSWETANRGRTLA